MNQFTHTTNDGLGARTIEPAAASANGSGHVGCGREERHET
jgi:hypothetical protein